MKAIRLKKSSLLPMMFAVCLVLTALLTPLAPANADVAVNPGEPCGEGHDGEACIGGTCREEFGSIMCVATGAETEGVQCETGINSPCPSTCSSGQTCGTSGSMATCRDRDGALTCLAADAPDTTTPTAATTIAPRNLPNPLGTSSLPELMARAITIFTSIAGSVALLMFVIGGLTWLTSGGNPDRIEKGKQAVVWAVIGLGVIFSGYAILRAIFTALGARL